MEYSSLYTVAVYLKMYWNPRMPSSKPGNDPWKTWTGGNPTLCISAVYSQSSWVQGSFHLRGTGMCLGWECLLILASSLPSAHRAAVHSGWGCPPSRPSFWISSPCLVCCSSASGTLLERLYLHSHTAGGRFLRKKKNKTKKKSSNTVHHWQSWHVLCNIYKMHLPAPVSMTTELTDWQTLPFYTTCISKWAFTRT